MKKPQCFFLVATQEFEVFKPQIFFSATPQTPKVLKPQVFSLVVTQAPGRVFQAPRFVSTTATRVRSPLPFTMTHG